VVETRSRKILGLHHDGGGRAPYPEFFAIMVSSGVLLEDLQSLESFGSTDISPIFEAAKEGVRQWQRS
jgi:hypothetical protein